MNEAQKENVIFRIDELGQRMLDRYPGDRSVRVERTFFEALLGLLRAVQSDAFKLARENELLKKRLDNQSTPS